MNEKKDLLVMEHRGTHIHFNLTDILYFYRFGKKVNFTTANGEEYPINLTISGLVERYGETGFIRINRGMVINHKIIRGYEVGARKNTLQLIIKDKYHAAVANLGTEQFQVTKEYMESFKTEFQGE